MRALLWTFALAVGLHSWAARGQDETETPPPTVITIRPAASPVPALKYSLLPKPEEQIPGNAAIFYHRAIEHVIEKLLRREIQARQLKKSPAEVAAEHEAQGKWLSQPLATLPRDPVRKYLLGYEFCLQECEKGARREFCDWEFRRRDEGLNLILSDMQEMRSLGRLLVLKTRLEIADGHIESAIHWLQTGLTVSHHVNSQSNTLIQMLISAAMTSMMAVPLEDLIQAPGAPNLYWALANLPRPFLELTTAMEGEKQLLEKEFPQLKTIDQSVWSVDQAHTYADDFRQKMGMLTNDWPRAFSSSARPDMKDFGSHLFFTALVARAYPESKRALIAQGRSAAQVEAMPAVQVVAIHSYRLYEEARDDIFKWAALPYWQGYKGMGNADDHPRAGWTKLRGGIPFSMILPAINSAYVVPARVDRKLDVVRIIEAVRLYAAGHGGALPPSLDAITEAPAPTDPATGKPYSYKLDGSTATLTAPGPLGLEHIQKFQLNYRLKLAQ